MERAVRTGGACLVTIRQLTSPGQAFLLKAVDSSLAFLPSSVST